MSAGNRISLPPIECAWQELLRKAVFLLALVVTISAGRTSHAQGETYEAPTLTLGSLLTHLREAHANLPREEMLSAYERYLADLAAERSRTAGDRARALEGRVKGYASSVQMNDSVERFRASIRSMEAIERRLFDALEAGAPLDQAPAVAVARAERNTARVAEIVMTIAQRTTNRTMDIDGVIMRTAQDPQARIALREVLARSAEARQRASSALVEAGMKGLQEMGIAAEAEGLVGVDMSKAFEAARDEDAAAAAAHAKATQGEGAPEPSEEEDVEYFQRRGEAAERLITRVSNVWRAGAKRVSRPSLELARLQWSAIESCAEMLPPGRRRLLVLQCAGLLAPELLPWEWEEYELSRILQWKRGPEGCNDRVREAVQAWLAEDTALLLSSVKDLLAKLPPDGGVGDDVPPPVEAARDSFSRKRAQEWAEFLKKLGPCVPPEGDPGLDRFYVTPQEEGSTLTPESASDFFEEPSPLMLEALGQVPEPEEPEQTDAERADESAEADRPAYEVTQVARVVVCGMLTERSLESLLDALGCSANAAVIAQRVHADALEEWKSQLPDIVEQAGAYATPYYSYGRRYREETARAPVDVRGPISTASGMARRQLDALATSLMAAIGAEMSQESLQLLQLAVRLNESVGRDTVREWVQQYGGASTNLAVALAHAELAPADRTAALGVIAARESALAQGIVAKQRALEEFCDQQERLAREPVPDKPTRTQHREREERDMKARQEYAASYRAVHMQCLDFQDQVVNEACGLMSVDGARKFRQSVDRSMFVAAWRAEVDAARLALTVFLALPPGDAATQRVSEAHARFKELVEPVRQRAIAVDRSQRACAHLLWQRARDFNDFLLMFQAQDAEFQMDQLFAVMAERLRAAVPSEVMTRSYRIRRIAESHGVRFDVD